MDKNIARDLNYDKFKERNEAYEKDIKKILKIIIKVAPKEIVVQVLKELKIIKESFNYKANKFELVERNDK